MTELGTADTTRMPVTTTYHGVEVTEDYRWLEDAGSEQTRAWTEAQHEHTMTYLRSLPSYDDIRRRAEEILEVDSTTYTNPTRGGQTYFVLKDQPPKQQPFLVALTDLSDAATERVVVDPNDIDAARRYASSDPLPASRRSTTLAGPSSSPRRTASRRSFSFAASSL